MHLKRTMAAAAIGLQATLAQAGGLAATVETNDVIVIPAEPQSSATGLIIPLILLALIAAGSNSDSAGGTGGDGDGGGGGEL